MMWQSTMKEEKVEEERQARRWAILGYGGKQNVRLLSRMVIVIVRVTTSFKNSKVANGLRIRLDCLIPIADGDRSPIDLREILIPISTFNRSPVSSCSRSPSPLNL